MGDEIALYSPIQPRCSGFPEVSPVHKIYYEESGIKDGILVIFIHGYLKTRSWRGCSERDRRYFDAEFYRIVLFDQRGAGKSTPAFSLEENDTWSLVADIEKLREHLGIEKWVVFGGSWGATLGLVYAETHIDRVLALSKWEMATSQLRINPQNLSLCEDEVFSLALSRIECHYFISKGFFKNDIYALDNANIIHESGIPVTIVQGRYDVCCPAKTARELYKKLPNAEFCIVDDAGHSAKEGGITKRLVEDCDKYKTVIKK